MHAELILFLSKNGHSAAVQSLVSYPTSINCTEFNKSSQYLILLIYIWFQMSLHMEQKAFYTDLISF